MVGLFLRQTKYKIASARIFEKRELGAKPKRSRRCKGEESAICHWGTGKAQNDDEPKPEYLLVVVFLLSYLRVMGKIIVLRYYFFVAIKTS